MSLLTNTHGMNADYETPLGSTACNHRRSMGVGDVINLMCNKNNLRQEEAMQVMRLNRHICSPFLLLLPSKQNRHRNHLTQRSKKFYPFVGYLLHMPLVGLSVKIIQLLWQIFLFIGTILFHKVIKKQQKI